MSVILELKLLVTRLIKLQGDVDSTTVTDTINEVEAELGWVIEEELGSQVYIEPPEPKEAS